MGKPTGAAVAAQAIAAVAEGHTYTEMDCQAFVEYCVTASGGAMAYAGSNDMARNAVPTLWTLTEAKSRGRLTAGAGLFIREEGGAPAKYQADGLGNFSHVGFYVGEDALTDVDKTGKSRSCNCVHSSASMGRVAGSTLKNGWTHVGWFREIDYGAAVGESDTGTDAGSATAAKKETIALTGKAATTGAYAAVDTGGFFTVKRGCKGGAVRRLQTWLLDLGYDLGAYGADGDFGAATDAAAKTFQRAQGLTCDGVVGRKTWAALETARRVAMEASAASTDEGDADAGADETDSAETNAATGGSENDAADGTGGDETVAG